MMASEATIDIRADANDGAVEPRDGRPHETFSKEYGRAGCARRLPIRERCATAARFSALLHTIATPGPASV